VSVKSGHVFEKKLIDKQLAITGRCPVTDQILEPSDLLPLKGDTKFIRNLGDVELCPLLIETLEENIHFQTTIIIQKFMTLFRSQ
jgi:hypothetical protein